MCSTTATGPTSRGLAFCCAPAGPAGSTTVKIRKGAGEDLGLDFEEYLMDKPWGCSNHCLFCFIDQLPRGLRRTLYFKDDDARLSFLTGSYITLTNLSEREMERICALKISPINVSVHATDPELRAKLMGNPKAADIMGPLRRLTAAGITVDCQIVCCPGYNDREQLSRSMRELSELLPRRRQRLHSPRRPHEAPAEPRKAHALRQGQRRRRR